ncbi:MAG: hypothetical protein C0476_04305 [Sphingomonas sp.]|nr:hypothetical protein [Sphingomonas sp.]
MIFLPLLMTAAGPPPALGAIERMTPEAAGDLVLAGRDHGPIATVARQAATGMDPPGVVELDLVERTVTELGGCIRRRWTATFRYKVGAPAETAVLSDARAATEVALPVGESCPSGQYAGVAPGTGTDAALGALRDLTRIRQFGDDVHATCTDETTSGLCAGPQAMRDALARIEPWAVSVRGDEIKLWLGTPGQVVTDIRYTSCQPMMVAIKRFIPPPF